MNIMDSRKFRRTRKPLKVEGPAEEDIAPIAPLESRENRLARRQAEETRSAAEAEAQRRAEEHALAEAEALRIAHARAEADQRAAAALAQEQADRAARERAAELAKEQAKEQARAEALAQARAEKNRRLAEEAARAAAAAEQARQDAENRARKDAEAHAAAEHAARAQAEAQTRQQAEDRARKDAEARAAAEHAARAQAEAEARQLAEDRARKDAEARAAAEQAARAAAEQRRTESEDHARAEAAAAARRASKARRIEDARLAEENRLAEQAAAARQARLSQAEETRRTHPAQPLPAPLPLTPAQRSDPWLDLAEMSPDLAHLNRNRIITADRLDPAHTTFDVLRTRLMHALNEKGWKRVAITSPGKDCGKTFTTANLAISLSRQENTRTLVMDFDMRRPSLHTVLGVASPGALGDVLRGTLDPEDHFLRMGQNRFDAGRNIAFALNSVTEPYASELLQDPRTAKALQHLEETFQPDVMLFDLPPALFYDDVIAFQPLFDGVLLVVGGGLTTEREIKEVERRLGPDTPLLGMVLNKAEGTGVNRYTY